MVRGFLEQRPGRYVKLLATLTIAAILLYTGFLLWGLHDRELGRARMETTNLTQLVIQQTERQFEGVDMVLLSVQERLQTPFGIRQDLGSDSVRLLLNSRVAALGPVKDLWVLDAKGRLVNAARELPPEGADWAGTDVYQAVARGTGNTLFIGKPAAQGAARVLHLARPLLDGRGSMRGVVVASMELGGFERLFSGMQRDYVRPLGFYLADGTRIASWPPQTAQELQNEEAKGPYWPVQGQALQLVREPLADGGYRLLVVGSLADYPVVVRVAEDEYQSLVHWRETALPIAVGAFLVSVFIALVAVYLAGKLRLKQQLTQALNAADQRYQHTVQSVMDAIVAVDEASCIVLFNPSAEKMFGYAAKAVLGQPLDMLIPARLQAAHHAHLQAFSGSTTSSRATALQTEIIGLRADGSEFPLESTISRSLIGGAMQMTAVLRDASERRRAEAELRLANSQLRELSASLQSVREEERKRISRELHDDLGQQLTGLKLSLSWLGSRLKDGKPTTAEHVDEMRHQMDAAIGSVRRLATELRPRVLDDVDFREALTWLTEDFFKHSGMQITLDLQHADRVNDDLLATALFRIVQEALTNVVRHAQATQVTVALHAQADTLHLRIADNGRGFDTNTSSKGVGLVGMRERCAAIGARFAVHSTPMEGTRVDIAVPLVAPLQTVLPLPAEST